MTDADKTLLIDIGGTLIRRDVHGPFRRAERLLAALGVDISAPERRLALAAAVLTGQDRDGAAATAAEALGLSASAAGELRGALNRGEGEATVLPGAIEILRTAHVRGWRVVAVSNAARWSKPLPDEVATLLDRTVASAEMGLLKQDERFWLRLLADGTVDRRSALVVGDSLDADCLVPASVGLCAVWIGDGDVLPSLPDVAGWLAAANEPPSDLAGIAVGVPTVWAGHRVIPVPHMTDQVKSVTRYRVRVRAGDRRSRTTVVRRRDLPPALLLPEAAPGAVYWLETVVDRRAAAVPEDLRTALELRGLSMDHLGELERRHLVSMVREASDPDIRRLRIDDAVGFLVTMKDREDLRVSRATADELFAGTAGYYARYRTPYPTALLDHVVAAAAPGRPSRLVDLGCGTGELTVPLAGHFDEAVGVDPTEDMIHWAVRRATAPGACIKWEITTAEEFTARDGRASLVTAGAAFHWMDRDVVARQMKRLLAPGGAFALAGSNSTWNGEEPWQEIVLGVIRDHLGVDRRAGKGSFGKPGNRHEEVLADNGFVDVDTTTFPVRHTWRLDDFVGYLYSTSFASRAVLGDRADAFEQDLRVALLDHEPSGTYTETLRFHCVIARQPR